MMIETVVCLAAAVQAPVPPGKLDPNHLALVFNRNSKPSGELAFFYAERRQVPRGRLIGLDLPTTEEIPRRVYDASIAGPIKTWLKEHDPADQVACLVLFYDVPIRVGPQRVTDEMRTARRHARRLRAEAIEQYDEVAAAIDRIAQPGAAPRTRPTTSTAPAPKRTFDKLAEDYKKRLTEAMKRGAALEDPRRALRAKKQLLSCMEDVQGLSGIVANVQPTDRDGNELGQRRFETLRESIRQDQDRINELLQSGPLSPDRQEARKLIRRIAGIFGLLAHLDEDLQRLTGRHTKASVDSELSTLLAPTTGLYRWRMNALNVRHRANETLREALPAAEWDAPILMVSRLDGPNPTVVRRCITDAIATEREGLTGRIYIDARGLKANPKPGAYGYYDQDLREMARLLTEHSSLPTVLDNRGKLFGPGACPDAAIYCGWYSVGRYEDAFDFVPGAVAFHIASNEAISLRDPTKTYWCKELLADGAAATLGPVAEPFLSAFPRPSDFFGLLMTGQLTLVECFYATKPYNSWMLLLIGDPLYRPFGKNPQMKLEDVLPADVLPLR